MKANVLMASADTQAFRRVQAPTGDVCHLELSASSGQTYDLLMRKPFQAVVVDTKLPNFDSLAFVHALQHAPIADLLVMTWGRADPVVYCAQPRAWKPVPVPRSTAAAVELLRSWFDPAAPRTIQEVRYQPKEGTFFVAFRNGKTCELSRKVIEADDGSAVAGKPAVIHEGEAFRVRLKFGKTYEVPWDFVLYHEEPTYPYHKGKTAQLEAEATRGRRIGARVRRAREERQWSQAELAQRTGMHVPNLSRLESGTHVPSLATLERVAAALGMQVADLVAT